MAELQYSALPYGYPGVGSHLSLSNLAEAGNNQLLGKRVNVSHNSNPSQPQLIKETGDWTKPATPPQAKG